MQTVNANCGDAETAGYLKKGTFLSLISLFKGTQSLLSIPAPALK